MIEETIPPALAGERLDRVVALLTGASRADAAALVAAGGAVVDEVEQRSGKMRLTVGQTVRVDPDLLPTDQLPVAAHDVDQHGSVVEGTIERGPVVVEQHLHHRVLGTTDASPGDVDAEHVAGQLRAVVRGHDTHR